MEQDPVDRDREQVEEWDAAEVAASAQVGAEVEVTVRVQVLADSVYVLTAG